MCRSQASVIKEKVTSRLKLLCSELVLDQKSVFWLLFSQVRQTVDVLSIHGLLFKVGLTVPEGAWGTVTRNVYYNEETAGSIAYSSRGVLYGILLQDFLTVCWYPLHSGQTHGSSRHNFRKENADKWRKFHVNRKTKRLCWRLKLFTLSMCWKWSNCLAQVLPARNSVYRGMFCIVFIRKSRKLLNWFKLQGSEGPGVTLLRLPAMKVPTGERRLCGAVSCPSKIHQVKFYFLVQVKLNHRFSKGKPNKSVNRTPKFFTYSFASLSKA